jgi:dienelactone hydrolase
VALHGCGGPGSQAGLDAAGARFAALGYVLLMVDSFGPRGVSQRCTIEAGSTVDRLMDAYGGLLFLAAQSFVEPDRIAVIGYSQGAGVALDAVELGGVEAAFDRRFKTAIAYYPPCPYSRDVAVPTLILIGAADDWTPARDCQEMMARRTGVGAPMRLVIYPDAYHAFNFASLRKPVTKLGHHLEYNEAADKAAWAETLAALKGAFGR